ncbi:MAG: CdaR family protein [Myxococcota bacterium]
MESRFENLRLGVLVVALVISVLIWAVAQGTSSIQESFDVPVELVGIEDGLVVTDQNSDAINVRLRGSRASLRNLDRDRMKYRVDVSGGKPGVAVYEVDVDTIEHPAGTSFAGYSPSRIQVRFEKRGRKEVGVRADISGSPAPGFHLVEILIEPPKVWLEGARSQVMRLSEVVTEAIDLAGLSASEKREVRLVLGGGTVWVEDKAPLQIEIRIEADLPPELLLELEKSDVAEGGP